MQAPTLGVPASHLLASNLRDAINALYSHDQSVQRPADAWLQTFRAMPGSWKICLQLLEAPHIQEHECYFAANNIKAACQRHQDMLEPSKLHEVLAKLALHMQACIQRHQWSTSQQLAGAAAAAAVRAAALQPCSILQELQNMFLPSSSAATVLEATHSNEEQLLSAAAATLYGGVWHPSVAAATLGNQSHGLHMQHDPVALAAMLQLLAALPDAATSKQLSIHPDRRTAVIDSFRQIVCAAPLLKAAMCSHNPKLITLACQAIISWCELGSPPRGLESHADALDSLAAALLARDTAAFACDAVASMLTAIKESSSGTSLSTSPSAQLLQQLVQQLQSKVLPALAAEHSSMGCAGPAAANAHSPCAGHAAEDSAPYSAVVRAHLGPDAEAAFCRVLCAAAAALLRPVLQGTVQYQPLLEALLQQLLLSVCVSDDGVAMMAVDFWQDCYLATLQALPSDQQAALLQQQRGVLEALAGAMVRRTQLSPAAAAAATADARDLPEEMRMVRRELASALRDIGALLGSQTMLSYIAQLVGSHYQHFRSTHEAANHSNSSSIGTPGLGLQGIAAGLAPGSDIWGPAASRWSPAATHTQTRQSGPSSESGNAALTSAARLGDWLPLESALYAANVVLGRQGGDTAQQQVQELVQYAAAAITHAGGIMKLAGTALTLLGGLAAWLAQHTASIPAVLTATAAALRSPDEKLSRNAATCIQRLSSCDDLALQICWSHGQFVQQLLQEYQRRGGLSSPLAEGSDDKPTEELLLLSLCSLAVAHTDNSSEMDSILLQLVGPQLTAATDELVAALHGSWPQQQQQQQAPAAHGGYWHLKQQQMQQQQQPQQRQPPVVQSTAVSCFKALTSLVTGLPTGVGKQALGVPMHNRHPRHQQQLQQQQQQQATAAGHRQLAAAVGSQGLRADADDASMNSASHSEVIDSRADIRGTAVTAGICQAHCSHPHCNSAQQHRARQVTAAATAERKQQQACFIVSQLLVRASQPVLLAMQAAAKAAGEQRMVCSLYAQQLLAAVCSFLLVAFPAAVHYQLMDSNSSTTGSTAVANVSHSCHSMGADVCQEQPATPNTGPSSSGSTLQAGVLLQQLCQLLQQLPVHLLQQPCCLQLLCSSVAAAAAAGALPAAECTDTAAVRLAAPATAATSQQQLLSMLQGLASQAFGAAASVILQQQGSADPDHTSAALGLATVSLQQCPAVLATSDLDLLLAVTLAATKTYHLKQCTAVLDWIQVLAQAAYPGQQRQVAGTEDSVQGGTSNSSTAGTSTLEALRHRLESGIGAQLVLSLLLAASGAMPPDVVLPISFCLHSVWLSVGQSAFVSWLTAAVLQLAPDSAPWVKQRHAAKVGFVSDMTDAACLTDTTRFKRILKNFCGGKKKGR